MRAITKGSEPPSLTQHKLTPNSDYDNYQNKGELRTGLVDEQRGLCCYCMSRIQIDVTAMKIEHWQCQSNYFSQQLNYKNLLGACQGGEGQPFHLQHCDTRKGNDDLLFNPAELLHRIETKIQYGMDGSISSDDETFNSQLNEVLNLNLPIFKNNRKAVLDEVIEWFKNEKNRLKGKVPKDSFQKKVDYYASMHGNLQPYSQVAVWWLRKCLERKA